MNYSVLWLFIGGAFMALEAFGVSGLGFLFAGLAAVCVALVVEAGFIGQQAFVEQAIIFFGLTALWAALLWKPLKRFQLGDKKESYNNIVGETAMTAGEGLTRGREGQVLWSGTLMRAQLAADESAESIPTGTPVLIARVEGNTLYVKRKG